MEPTIAPVIQCIISEYKELPNLISYLECLLITTKAILLPLNARESSVLDWNGSL